MLIDPPGGLLELIQPKRLERVTIRGLLPPEAESLARARQAGVEGGGAGGGSAG